MVNCACLDGYPDPNATCSKHEPGKSQPKWNPNDCDPDGKEAHLEVSLAPPHHPPNARPDPLSLSLTRHPPPAQCWQGKDGQPAPFNVLHPEAAPCPVPHEGENDSAFRRRMQSENWQHRTTAKTNKRMLELGDHYDKHILAPRAERLTDAVLPNWRPCTVVSVGDDGTFEVAYCDETTEREVARERLRFPAPEPPTRAPQSGVHPPPPPPLTDEAAEVTVGMKLQARPRIDTSCPGEQSTLPPDNRELDSFVDSYVDAFLPTVHTAIAILATVCLRCGGPAFPSIQVLTCGHYPVDWCRGCADSEFSKKKKGTRVICPVCKQSFAMADAVTPKIDPDLKLAARLVHKPAPGYKVADMVGSPEMAKIAVAAAETILMAEQDSNAAPTVGPAGGGGGSGEDNGGSGGGSGFFVMAPLDDIPESDPADYDRMDTQFFASELLKMNTTYQPTEPLPILKREYCGNCIDYYDSERKKWLLCKIIKNHGYGNVENDLTLDLHFRAGLYKVDHQSWNTEFTKLKVPAWKLRGRASNPGGGIDRLFERQRQPWRLGHYTRLLRD